MGACCSVDENTKYINSKLASENKKQARTNKILFLGPGGSGKTTIFKQLQWLHLDGFAIEDAMSLIRNIHSQVITQMQNVIQYYEAKEEKRTYEDDVELQNAINTVRGHNDLEEPLYEDLADAIQYIWNNDPFIRNVFNVMDYWRHQILDESTEHFWNDMERIKDPKYIPTETDILNVRSRTTGVKQKEFTIKNTHFHIYDVGGQKSERKKWINCFNEVKAVLFVIALSCYNEMMYEDIHKNCMVDSLELFDETVNNKHFNKTHIILFLNKKDLFVDKIGKIPITFCEAFSDFNEYQTGLDVEPNPNDFEQTTAYIQHKFRTLNKNNKKQIYVHLTTAMDRKNIDNVFRAVKHICIKEYSETIHGVF
eukprot:174187_1